YLIDILLPFAMYLVLGMIKQPVLRSKIVRGGLVLGVGAISETLQYFGVPIFGQTFDPLDYVMFGLGIGLAITFERFVLSRIPEHIAAAGQEHQIDGSESGGVDRG
ncbi:MAG: hypothetical protein ACK2UU_04185, partial [Anaerolineae bacterium]